MLGYIGQIRSCLDSQQDVSNQHRRELQRKRSHKPGGDGSLECLHPVQGGLPRTVAHGNCGPNFSDRSWTLKLENITEGALGWEVFCLIQHYVFCLLFSGFSAGNMSTRNKMSCKGKSPTESPPYHICFPFLCSLAHNFAQRTFYCVIILLLF